MDFVIDTVGEAEELGEGNGGKSHTDYITELLKEYKESSKREPVNKANKKENTIVQEVLQDLGWNNRLNPKKQSRKHSNVFQGDLNNKNEVEDILKKSIVLSPEFETLHSIPSYDISAKNLRKQKKEERAKTKGKKWFGLPATELTEEVKHDLEILQMRSVLDPKRFYKKNDLNVLPKYFQIGKVMDSPVDYYNSRLPKKQRKKTLVDELLADAEFNKYNKRKYKEIIEDRQKTHYKAWRAAKKLKKKNK